MSPTKNPGKGSDIFIFSLKRPLDFILPISGAIQMSPLSPIVACNKSTNSFIPVVMEELGKVPAGVQSIRL